MPTKAILAPIFVLLVVAFCGCAEIPIDGTTASIAGEIPPSDQRPSDEALLKGKDAYTNGDYGLAEQHFRAATEANPKSIDAWVGLAASYDRLHRFDLADRAYEPALALAGRTPEMLNNLGYHYLLAGNRKKASQYLNEAAQLDPHNPYILGNLKLLREWSSGPG